MCVCTLAVRWEAPPSPEDPVARCPGPRWERRRGSPVSQVSHDHEVIDCACNVPPLTQLHTPLCRFLLRVYPCTVTVIEHLALFLQIQIEGFYCKDAALECMI